MKSFKTFMMAQSDDTAHIDVYRKRYDDYQVEHCMRFNQFFFDANKGEEWFQERYDPLRRQEQLKETAAWAVNASAEMKAALERNTEAMLQACSLEPSANRNNRVINAPEGEADKAIEATFSGRHIPG